MSMIAPPALASRQLLVRQLAAALAYSSAFAVPLFLLAPATLALYGKPYDSQLTTYALLLAVQWVNGVGRPAVRHAVRRFIDCPSASGFLSRLILSQEVTQ
jgi:hypothetical protein